jgi:hypothetical protein
LTSELWRRTGSGTMFVSLAGACCRVMVRLGHRVGSIIGDTHHVATVATVLGNAEAAVMLYIHADDDASSRASQEVGEAVATLMK